MIEGEAEGNVFISETHSQEPAGTPPLSPDTEFLGFRFKSFNQVGNKQDGGRGTHSLLPSPHMEFEKSPQWEVSRWPQKRQQLWTMRLEHP